MKINLDRTFGIHNSNLDRKVLTAYGIEPIGFHIRVVEDCTLFGYDVALTGKRLPLFQKNILPTSASLIFRFLTSKKKKYFLRLQGLGILHLYTAEYDTAELNKTK